MNVHKKVLTTCFVVGVVLLFLMMSYRMNQRVSFQQWNLPLAGKVIVIDPGHGGIDGGATFNGVIEKNVTLPISLRLRDYLQEQGALVLMTREKDVDLASSNSRSIRERKRTDLIARTKFINNSEADLYISVHANAFPQVNSKGAQTFYSPKFSENKQAAKLMESVYLVKHANKPGVLVEVGFLSNDEERRNLQNKVYQDDIALSIYTGVIRYFLKEHEED